MSLDQNLFTLNIITSSAEDNAVDLVDPSGHIHYRKRRTPTPQAAYTWSLFEPHSDGLLSTVSSASAVSKHKTIVLHNPDAIVELKFTGSLSFKWCFEWGGHTFEWRREACFILRKPDPPVQVAVTKEPSGRIKTSTVQLLDYNLNRFDIDDRKGLEICMLTALLTFQDSAEEYHSKSTLPSPSTSNQNTPAMESPPPPPPPPPPRKSAAVMIAKAQADENLELNEIIVEDDIDVEEYAEFGYGLLLDKNLLFVILRSAAPEHIPKVLAVAEQIKRLQHKTGSDETLHMYPSYSDAPRKGPKVINLDDPSPSNPYQLPEMLTIHLSKIAMPELQPRPKKTVKRTGGRASSDNEGEQLKPSKHGKNKSTSGYVSADNRAPSSSYYRPEKPSSSSRAAESNPFRAASSQASSSNARPGAKSKPAPSPFPGQPDFPDPRGSAAPRPSKAGHLAKPSRPSPPVPALNVTPPQAEFPPYQGRPQPSSQHLSAGAGGQPTSPSSPSSRPVTLFDRFTKW